MRADTDYQFAAEIRDYATQDLVGMQFGAMFRLDPATFVDGCPLWASLSRPTSARRAAAHG